MLASRPVRAAGERVAGLLPVLGAALVTACALFGSGGPSDAPLVWIGGLALLVGAALLVRPVALPGPAALLLGSLFGLTVWSGLSTIWSISPDRSWTTTNRTLVYAAFALVGVLAGSRVSRDRLAEGAAFLLGALVVVALVAKCVPALYGDYDRVARLRAPVDYWNELALLCAAGVPVALWLAAVRRRAEGVLLLYGLAVTLLLTYSRFGVALACAAALAWTLLDRDRVESIVAVLIAAVGAGVTFAIALALPGITDDAQPRHVRVHDSWIFALVLIAAAALVYLVARALRTREASRESRARIERGAAIVVVVLLVVLVVLSIVFAGRLWSDFTNPAGQLSNSPGHLGSARSNRWTWWHEAWDAFTRHPFGGTGAGTFELTNQMLRRVPIVVDDPHSTPLRFLSETGIVGFLLYLGAAAGALWGAWRARVDAAGLALGIGVATFFVHTLVDKDWNYVAGCGPMLLLAGALTVRPAVSESAPVRRRPLVAVCALAVALAGIYSLAAPWLAERALVDANWKQAHSYDPLNVDAILEWATFEEATGKLQKAASLYRDATDLEPENAYTWYQRGAFYYRLKQWQDAYEALNTAYTYDRLGKAAEHCGLLDRARWNAGYRFGVKCPAEGRSSSP
jgi:O-Antigen ligase